MRPAMIIDLDGTLSDNEHRAYLAEEGKWDEFHSKCEEDKPHKDVVALMHNSAINFIILTGRNEKYRPQTIRWLDKHHIPCDVLLMRPDEDRTPDITLKPYLLERYFCGKKNALEYTLCALDDRDKVVKMWRDYGIRCWQVKAGTY